MCLANNLNNHLIIKIKAKKGKKLRRQCAWIWNWHRYQGLKYYTEPGRNQYRYLISFCFNFCLDTPQTGKKALFMGINKFWLCVTNFTHKNGIQQPPTQTLIHVLK